MHSLIEQMEFFTILEYDTNRRDFITKFQRIFSEEEVHGGVGETEGSLLRNENGDEDGSAVNSN